MSNATNYLENLINKAIFSADTLSVATPYLALYTSAPSDAGGGTEVSGGDYARADLSSSFPAASGTTGAVANNAEIEFMQASANWGTVTHVAVHDDATSGNMLIHDALNSPVAVTDGDTFKIPVGSFISTVA